MWGNLSRHQLVCSLPRDRSVFVKNVLYLEEGVFMCTARMVLCPEERNTCLQKEVLELQAVFEIQAVILKLKTVIFVPQSVILVLQTAILKLQAVTLVLQAVILEIQAVIFILRQSSRSTDCFFELQAVILVLQAVTLLP
jgi:hypothetical protein